MHHPLLSQLTRKMLRCMIFSISLVKRLMTMDIRNMNMTLRMRMKNYSNLIMKNMKTFT